jgi:tetratricopeptide (TPR) repeat protein
MRRIGNQVGLALALPALVLAAYWPALHGGFIWDDDAHVTRPDLRSILGLWRIWSEPGATQQYYPVLHSAFWVEHHLWGDAALGYHLANVGLHLGACFLLLALLRRLAVPGAVLAVAVFALHPVCVETVAWVSEQKNTLSTVFYLMAALAYLRFDSERRARWYAAGLALFALALLSKSVTATLPAAILVVIWWKRGLLSIRTDVLPLLPWFGLGIAVGMFTAWVERAFVGASGAAFNLGPVERLLIAGRATWFYLGKVLWPVNLVFIYPRWTVTSQEAWQYLYPAAALCVLAAFFLLRGRSRTGLAAALLYVGTLFPALGFVNVYPFVFSFVADHFQYLAAAFAIAALCAAATVLAHRLPARMLVASRVSGAALVGVLAFLTWRQCGDYRDVEAFYRSILAGNPDSWMAHDNLGVVLVQKGKADEAVVHYREAIRLNPSYPEAFNNYGNVLAKAGRWSEAEEAYAGALKARPTFAAAEYNWGYALNQAGQYARAETHLRNALRLKAGIAEVHYELGNALANSGRMAEAMDEYRQALALKPEFAEAHANLGLALAEQGNLAEAIAQISVAVRLRPEYAEAHAYYGFALAGSGQLEEALAQYGEALRRGPNSANIHYQMGITLRKLGRLSEANEQFREARRLEALPGRAPH